MPHDSAAEMACLGAVLIKNKLIDEIFSSLKADDFYDGRHQIIIKSFLDHRNQQGNIVIDTITLKDILDKKSLLKEAGGLHYITQLIDSVPSISHAGHYASIVKEKSLLRQIMDICEQGKLEAAKSELDTFTILEQVQQRLFDLIKTGYSDYEHIRDVISAGLAKLEDQLKNQGNFMGIPTGYRELDDLIGGLCDGHLIIIGARPSMGKTALAISLLQNMSISPRMKPISAGFFSLEMPKTEIGLRLLAAEAQISGDKFRRGHSIERDWEHIVKAAETIIKAPIYIDDTPNLTINELSAKTRKMVQEGVQIIFVDYLQLMSHPNETINREQQIATISRRLKGIARELSIPVVALTQLNRATETRPNKIPMLSDIRESGSIEQDADIVCFIHREDYYRPPNEEHNNIATIKVAKNRHGATGDAKLMFHSHYARFDNLAPTPQTKQ